MTAITEASGAEWECRIPLLTNRFIVWDLLKVSALSPAIMWGLVALMGWFLEGEPVLLPWFVVLGTGAGLIVLLAASCLLLGNGVDMRFSVTTEGVGYESGTREKALNRITAAAGLLAGSATTAGAGLLASSSESGGWEWADITRVAFHPAQRVISLKNSWRTLIRLYCPPGDYDAIAALVTAFAGAAEAQRRVEPSNTPPPAFRWPRALGWTAAAATAGVCTQAWYWSESDHAARGALAGAVLLMVAAWLPENGRRLVGLLALPGPAWHAVNLGVSALDPIESWDGSVALSATLDTGLLALAAFATLSLLATGVYFLMPARDDEAVLADL